LVLRRTDVVNEDGNLFWGKNPRKLQLWHDGPSGRELYESHAYDRLVVDRRVLLDAGPDGDYPLTPEAIRLIRLWIGKRYNRDAFPDAFETRLRGAGSKIRRLLTSSGDLLSGIYLQLDSWDELPKEIPYRIGIRATMKVSRYEDAPSRRRSSALLDQIAACMAQREGIEVLDHRLESEVELTIDDLSYVRRWDFDELSIRTNPPGDLVVIA
jgi:hypothetical protein